MFNLSTQPTRDELFLWILHAMTSEFKEEAILKGGMVLRLLDCHRSTNDLDYVLVPYRSKNEVISRLEKVLKKIPNVRIQKSLNSKVAHFDIFVDSQALQLEVNVDMDCASVPLSTAALANRLGQLTQIIRVMSFDVALAHKLAAWNERRILRDLYDIYFYHSILQVEPNKAVVEKRLSKIESRIPQLKLIKEMSLSELAEILRQESRQLSAAKIKKELTPLLPQNELSGLENKIKISLLSIADKLIR